MSNDKGLRLFFVLIIHLIIFISFGCQKKSHHTQRYLYQASTPIAHFDPHMTTGLSDAMQMGKMYEGLLEVHPYNPPYEMLANLAESLPTMSNSGKTLTFKIRKGVYYHPCECFKGKKREVKAQDFETTFKRIADPKLISPRYNNWTKKILGLKEYYEINKKLERPDYSIPIKGVKALDDYTLQITAINPDPYFMTEFATPATAPLPIEALEYYKNDLSQNVIGTGPFLLEKYVRKSRIEYKRNPNFRDKFFPKTGAQKFASYISEYGGKKIPFLDGISVKIMAEAQTQWLNFMKGKVDYLEIPKDNFADSVTPTKSLSPGMSEKGIKLGITKSDSNVYYLGFNNKNKFLKNKHLRKAIAYAFDQEQYNQLFFNNTAVIANSILPPNIPGNKPPIKSPYLGKNLAKAREHLKLAGYPNGEGLPKIVISVRSSTLARQVGEFFVKEMKGLGLKADIDVVTWSGLLQKVQRGNYMIFYLAWFVGLPTGLSFYELLYGPNWPSSYNRMGYQSAEFDHLFDQSIRLSDTKKQNELIHKMNKVALDDLPLFPLVHARDFFVHQGWLKNYVPSETAGGMEQYYDVDLESKKKLKAKF